MDTTLNRAHRRAIERAAKSARKPGRRPGQVKVLPTPFAFSDDVKEKSLAQARSALLALLEHKATQVDLETWLHIAAYSNLMVDRMLASDGFDGTNDVALAVKDGSDAILEVQKRYVDKGLLGTAGPEREPLQRLMDAYEAMLGAATRRESMEVIRRVNSGMAAAQREAV